MGLFDAFAFLGGIIIYPVAGFAITFLSWRAAFFLPALLLLMWSVVFCIYVKDTPQQYGFTVEWEHSGVSDVKDPASASEDAKDSAKTPASDTVCLRDYADVMKHPAILLTALATICSQFVRWGLVNWIVKILITPCSVDAPGLAESAGGGFFAGGWFRNGSDGSYHCGIGHALGRRFFFHRTGPHFRYCLSRKPLADYTDGISRKHGRSSDHILLGASDPDAPGRRRYSGSTAVLCRRLYPGSSGSPL